MSVEVSTKSQRSPATLSCLLSHFVLSSSPLGDSSEDPYINACERVVLYPNAQARIYSNSEPHADLYACAIGYPLHLVDQADPLPLPSVRIRVGVVWLVCRSLRAVYCTWCTGLEGVPHARSEMCAPFGKVVISNSLAAAVLSAWSLLLLSC